MTQRTERGAYAEEYVVGWLEEQLGWRILDRNVRYRCGELDVVARDATSVVIVEIRSAWGRRGPRPEDTVTLPKQRRLTRAAQLYAMENKLMREIIRFDVVAFDGRIRRVSAHHRGAFEAMTAC